MNNNCYLKNINSKADYYEVTTHRPSEGEVEMQSDGVGEGESVLAEGVTRYIAEATGADGSDVRLVFLKTEPEGC